MQNGQIYFDSVSPDGRSTYHLVPHSFSTTTMRSTATQGTVYMSFSSTAQFLMRTILPQLNLGGEPGQPQQFGGQRIPLILEKIAARGGRNLSGDSAAVLVKNVSSGLDAFVIAYTTIFSAHSPVERSVTSVTILRAPADRIAALAERIDQLPLAEISPEWDRLHAQQTQVSQQQTQDFIREYNTRQTSFNNSQMQANSTARIAQQARADQSLSDSQKAQQAIADQGALSIHTNNNTGVGFQWCDADTGRITVVANSTVSPGQSWYRCGP